MGNKGVLVVISGFSGAGKGTIMKQLIQKDGYALSISATTRGPRPGEQRHVCLREILRCLLHHMKTFTSGTASTTVESPATTHGTANAPSAAVRERCRLPTLIITPAATRPTAPAAKATHLANPMIFDHCAVTSAGAAGDGLVRSAGTDISNSRHILKPLSTASTLPPRDTDRRPALWRCGQVAAAIPRSTTVDP